MNTSFVQKLLAGSWKDPQGRTLIFLKEDPQEKGLLTLAVDGTDCSEGICETVPPEPEEICRLLNWYHLSALAEVFSRWAESEYTA